MSSLSDKAVGGVLWTGVERFGGKTIQFLSTIVLARILLPEDYGAIASIIIFFAVANILIDSGFSQALIREEKITEKDKSTTFFINLFVALLLAAIIWLLSGPISNFYNNPVLVDLTRFMAITPLLTSLTIVQRAYFTHRINFRTQAYIHLLSSFGSSALSIYAAVKGLGVWALATQYVSLSLFNVLFYWIANPWIPRSFISKDSFDRLFGFGYKLMVASLINITYQNLYKVIIGKLYQNSILGFYAQAENIKKSISENLIGTLTRVNYATLSKLKDDNERLKEAYIKTVKATSFFVFPAMTGLILVAEPFVVTAISSKWLASVPILQVLALSGMIYHLGILNLDVLKILGRSDLLLRLEIIKKAGATVALVIGFNFGLWGLIFAQVLSAYYALIINMIYTSRLLGYSTFNQLKDVIGTFFYSLPMLIIVFATDFLSFELQWVRLVVLTLVGIFVYLGMSLIFKPPTFRDVILILRPTVKFLNKIKV